MLDSYSMESSVKEWYQQTFPSDNLGLYLPDRLGDAGDFFLPDIEAANMSADEPVSFCHYQRCLDEGGDVYELMGEAVDSIVRERIFAMLADLQDVDYDKIYYQWLDNGR